MSSASSSKFRNPPWTAAQTYELIGSLRDPTNGRLQAYSLIILAQDGVGPVITGGFSKLNVIDRAKRIGYTMPAGWDPIGMDLAVQFEAMTAYDDGYSPALLEDDIQKLEWMGGRGTLFATSGVGNAAVGDPPLVQVRSVNDSLQETGLIPQNLRGVTWMIADIQPGTEIRNASGQRRRAQMTISLLQWVPVPTTRVQLADGFQTFPITQQDQTILDVVVHNTNVNRSDVTALKQVLAACRAHGVPVKSYLQKLKTGTKVYIPNSLYASG